MAVSSTGGAKFHEFGPFLNASGTPYASVKLHAYNAGGYTVAKTFWTDEAKAGAVTTATGDTSGRVSGYFDGDYAIEILQSDDATPLVPTFKNDNINITGDFGTNYETQQGTAAPAATAANKGMSFAKFDGSANLIAYLVSNGTSFTTLIELTAAGVPAFDNLATLIMPVANVMHPDYGAVGDGVTNDTAAIQAAIDAIEAEGGGIVWLPEGTYKVSTTLQIGAVTGNMIFRGASKGATIIKTAHASNDILRLGDGSTTREDITVMQMTFDSSVTRSGGAAITLDKVQDCTLDSIKFEDQYNSVDTAASNSTVYMVNFTIKDTVATNGTGITLSHGNDYYIDTFIMDTSITEPKSGIFMDSVTSVFISNAHILNAGTGIYIEPGAGETVSNVFIGGTKVNGCTGNGMLINSSTATSNVHTIKVSNSFFSDNTENGIKVTGHASATLDDIEFDNLSCNENAKHGIFFAEGINNSANSCTCSGNDSGDTDTYSGIAVSAGISQFELTNNKCGIVAEHANTQNYGIQVAAGASDDYTIIGNTLLNNKNGDLSDGGTGDRKITEPNLIDVWHTTMTTIASATTITIPDTEKAFTISGALTVVTIDGGWPSREITLLLTGAVNFTNLTGNLELAGGVDWTTGVANDTISFMSDGTTWYETARSSNI